MYVHPNCFSKVQETPAGSPYFVFAAILCSAVGTLRILVIEQNPNYSEMFSLFSVVTGFVVLL